MRMRTAGLIAAMLLMAWSTVYAEEPTGWRFEITPTAWIAGIEGTVTVDGQKTDFEKSAGDLFDYVEFAGGLIGAVQYKHWIFRGQFDLFSLSTDALDVEDQPKGGKLDSDMLLTEAAVGYQINGWMEGQTYDFLVGLRSLHTEADLEVYGEGGGTYSKDSDLLDPLVGVRGSFPIFPSKIKGLRLNAMASIGGGGDSDLIYELQPALQYQFTDNVAVRLGYRRVAWQVDSDKNDDELDFSLAGLIAAVAVRF
jgi:hypothetical protein